MPENSGSSKRLHPSRRSSMFRTSPLLHSVVHIKGCLRPKSLYSHLSSLYLLTLYCQYVCAYPTGSCPLCIFCRSSRAAPTPAVKSTGGVDSLYGSGFTQVLSSYFAIYSLNVARMWKGPANSCRQNGKLHILIKIITVCPQRGPESWLDKEFEARNRNTSAVYKILRLCRPAVKTQEPN